MSIGPGAILGGRYRLEDSIGRGGMGEVFQATNLDSGQRVAIKVVNRSILDTLLAERLLREAEAARRIQSEFVPQLYDVDRTPDGELFLVLELLYGEALSSRLRRRGNLLTWEEVFALGEDVLCGLHDAHSAGVIHRDLKPANIFLEALPGRRERARVLDFGVCKLDVHDGESLTVTGEAVGTIAYMAPEQIRGASRVDERADLYAFATVVFETLCGRLAYDAGGSIALIACKLEKSARSLRDLARVPVPVGLDALMARCLARRPADRPATAADLLRLWRELGPATVAPQPAPAGIVPSDQPTETAISAPPTMPSASLSPGVRVGLLVAAAAILVSGGVMAFGLRLGAAAPAAGPETVAGAAQASVTATVTATVTAIATAPGPGVAPVPGPGVIAAGDLPVAQDAPDAAAAVRPTPRRRRLTPAVTTPRKAPSEPQIVTEPRY